jgi:hypothetical protein
MRKRMRRRIRKSELEDFMGGTRNLLWLLVAAALGTGACSGRDDDSKPAIAGDPVSGDYMTVTGCLSGASDRGAFVLTADRNALTSGALHSGSGEVPTYTYELVGGSEELASHVGKKVAVKGRLDDDRDDELDKEVKSKTELPPTRSGDDVVTPAIRTKEELEIQVRRLRVESITPTGSACNQ